MTQINHIDSIVPIVFHYNKQHNIDSTIPPWVVKAKGETFYVHHIDVDKGIGFSTKETPDNPHTKASLKFKGKLTIEKQNDEIIAKIHL